MSRIKAKDTAPEMTVRKVLKSIKVRHKANPEKLPGKPDLLLTHSEVLIFVHGCFWHRCSSKKCTRANMPKSNQAYWRPKLERNVSRDRENIKKLKKLGWKPYIIWECQTRNHNVLRKKILKILCSNNIGYIKV